MLLRRKSACKTSACSSKIFRWLASLLGPNLDIESRLLMFCSHYSELLLTLTKNPKKPPTEQRVAQLRNSLGIPVDIAIGGCLDLRPGMRLPPTANMLWLSTSQKVLTLEHTGQLRAEGLQFLPIVAEACGGGWGPIALQTFKAIATAVAARSNRRAGVEYDRFFSSSMADVALWLGPYMSISRKTSICTRTKRVRKCRQITTNQTTQRPARRPANPPARLAFRQEKQQTRHTKGAGAQTKTPTKKICQRTQWFDHCITLKNMRK